MAANKKLVNPKRWPGVYYYESTRKRLNGRPDVCYYFTYKIENPEYDKNVQKTKENEKKGETISKFLQKTEKVGWKSEGYTPHIAAELRSDLIRELRHGKSVKTAKEIQREKIKLNRRLDELADIYFENRKGSIDAAKFDRYRYNKHVSPLLGNKTAREISPLDVEKIKKRMEGLADATVWGALEILRRIVNYGVKVGLSESLSFKIDMPKRDNEVTEYLTPKQLERLNKLLDSWPSQDVARMLRLAMLSGMRRGEIFKLEDRDIDFIQGIITLRKPKGKKTASIPLSKPVAKILKDQQAWRDEYFPKSPFVFPGKNGLKREDCSAVYRIKRKANLPNKFRIFHGLRHHFGVTLANSGKYSLDMIGKLLTHKSIEMTKRYAKFLPNTVRNASERAAEMIQRQATDEINLKNINMRDVYEETD
jgi:integrase